MALVFHEKVDLPNSLLAISDTAGGIAPQGPSPSSPIAATETCVMVGCMFDAETDIAVVQGEEDFPRDRPEYDGILSTPSRAIALWQVAWDRLCTVPVPAESTRVRIWTNKLRQPDRVVIGVG